MKEAQALVGIRLWEAEWRETAAAGLLIAPHSI